MPTRLIGWAFLLNMIVIVDVILTVAMIAFTAGAVPELQVRMAHIRFAADFAFVRVCGRLLCRFYDPELNGRLRGGGCFLFALGG